MFFFNNELKNSVFIGIPIKTPACYCFMKKGNPAKRFEKRTILRSFGVLSKPKDTQITFNKL